MSVDLYHNTFSAMGTRLDVILWGLKRPIAHSIYQDMLNEVNRLEGILSHFNKDSPVSRINTNAGRQAVEVSEELFAVLSECRKYWELTDGLFDITALPLIQIYKFPGYKNPEHQNDAIGHALKITGMNKMRLDREHGRVYLEKEGMQIDLGGIGKGIALEHIDRILTNRAISNAFVSFGESSVLARGRHPYGDCWKTGIRNITDDQKNAHSVELKDAALSTSGNVDKEAGDIVNPKTGTTPDKISITSVISKSAADAAVLSSTLLLASNEEKKEILINFNPEKAIEMIYENQNEQPFVKEWYNP